MNELNEQLKGISELVTRIDAKVLEITTKLDELIAALHEYDGNVEYGESSFEVFQDEEATNKRMDIIGQNGNEGSHYVTNKEADEDAATFNDYGQRVVGDNNNNTQGKDKRVGGKKNKHKYYKPKQTK